MISLTNLGIVLISFVLTMFFQNKQGNITGSFFLKLTKTCIHIHHWMTSIIIVIVLKYFIKDFKHKNKLISAIIGYGLAGFIYSDRFHIMKMCYIK
jgi:hypothetical protein